MTVSGQFSCPPAGNFVAVSGQFLVAADNRPAALTDDTTARGWSREIERHETTKRRLEQLLHDLA